MVRRSIHSDPVRSHAYSHKQSKLFGMILGKTSRKQFLCLIVCLTWLIVTADIEITQDIDYDDSSANASVFLTANFNVSEDGDWDCLWKAYAGSEFVNGGDALCDSMQCTCTWIFVYGPGNYNATIKIREVHNEIRKEQNTSLKVIAPIDLVLTDPPNMTSYLTNKNLFVTAALPPGEFGDLNYTWEVLGDGVNFSVTSPYNFIGKSFEKSGPVTVYLTTTNVRSSYQLIIQYIIFDPVKTISLFAPSNDVTLGDDFSIWVVSDNATDFSWDFPDADLVETCACANFTLSLNSTGYHNYNITASNPASSQMIYGSVHVTPPPTPDRTAAKVAEISTPIIVVIVLLVVAAVSFMSHRWYLARRGVEVADFDFSISSSPRRKPRRSVMESIKSGLMEIRSPRRSSRAAYGTINVDDL